MANYPSTPPSFTTKIDGYSSVLAADVNNPYAEIVAIANTLGTLPSQTNWGGSFDTATTDFTTVTARISNLEAGTKEAFNNRVKTVGGSTITSAGTTVGLTISSTGTGNLFVAGNTTINNAGYIVTLDGGTA